VLMWRRACLNGAGSKGPGLPSFYAAEDEGHVKAIKDVSFGIVWIETRCARCDSHKGHVFPTAPLPSASAIALLHQLDLAGVRENRRAIEGPAASRGQAAGSGGDSISIGGGASPVRFAATLPEMRRDKKTQRSSALPLRGRDIACELWTCCPVSVGKEGA
jgi:hypothetical protein